MSCKRIRGIHLTMLALALAFASSQMGCSSTGGSGFSPFQSSNAPYQANYPPVGYQPQPMQRGPQAWQTGWQNFTSQIAQPFKLGSGTC